MPEKIKVFLVALLIEIFFIASLFFAYKKYFSYVENKKKEPDIVQKENEKNYLFFFQGQEYSKKIIEDYNKIAKMNGVLFLSFKYLAVVIVVLILFLIFNFIEIYFFKTDVIEKTKNVIGFIVELLYLIVSGILKLLETVVSSALSA